MRGLEAHDVVMIVGKRGSGKSHQAKALCGLELAAGARVAVFDPHDEYSIKGRATKGVTLGPLPQRFTMDELLEKPSLLDGKKLGAAFVPRGRLRSQIAADFRDFAKLVLLTGGLTVVADEVGEYDDTCKDELETLATQSRHYEMPVVLVAQRATQVPKTARSQASQIFCGLQDEEDDLKALGKRCGKDFSDRVSRLPRRTLIVWRDTTTQPKEAAS